MANVCIAVLCGLPASGKSNLSQQLLRRSVSENEKFKLPLRFIVVEYDDLLPPETERTLIEGTTGDQESEGLSPWKSYRQQIYKCVDLLISLLKNSDQTSHNLELDCTQDIAKSDLWKKLIANNSQHSLHICNEKKPNRDCLHICDDERPVCVVIDDNMYYRSMRYTYYQLARKYNTGFCQVYLHTAVEGALTQNALRSANSVSDETIIQMAERFEEPKSSKYGWEENTLTLSDTPGVNDTSINSIYQLIEKALSQPVVSPEADDMEAIMESREVCSANILHQSDVILRKLVSMEMGKGKESGMEKESLKSLAIDMQWLRKQFIEELREGRIHIPQHIATLIKHDANNQTSDLFLFISDLFCKRKSEIIIKNGKT